MKHAKFFSLAVFTIALTYVGVGFYFLPLTTFQGDLTRMGLVPESLFGWTQPQPAIDPALMHQATMKEADVLVIGDSFSAGRIWQTALTQRGLKVRTESWNGMRGICADFMPWLRAQGFKGRYLVLESLEHYMVNILERSVACPSMQYRANVNTDRPRDPPIVSFDTTYGNYSGRFSIGIQTRLNVAEYERLSRAADFKVWTLPNDIKMARLENGCELFSHVRCQDSLFMADDKAEDVEPSALENIEKLNARLPGITPIWAFVPNRSTSYLYPDKQFWNTAEQRFQAPNLLRMTQRAIHNKTVDLYPANNTHFSTTGYLLMGQEISKAIQPLQPQAAPTSAARETASPR